MKIEARVFGFWTVFFMIEAAIYIFGVRWSEPAGSIALIGSVLFAAMITVFIKWTATKTAVRPEDLPNGSDIPVEGEYGDFSPGSYWPILVAIAISIVALGIAVDWWLVWLDAPFVALCVIGWCMEGFRA